MFEEVTKHGWDPMWTEVDRLITFGVHSNICAAATTPPDRSENISQSKVLHQSKQLYTIYCRFGEIYLTFWTQRGPPQHLHACCPVGAGSSYPGSCVCAATQTRKLKRGFKEKWETHPGQPSNTEAPKGAAQQ